MNLYSPPKLTVVGPASEVILGMCSVGWDLDTCLMVTQDECASVDDLDFTSTNL